MRCALSYEFRFYVEFHIETDVTDGWLVCNPMQCSNVSIPISLVLQRTEFIPHFVPLNIMLPAATQTSLFQVREINSRRE